MGKSKPKKYVNEEYPELVSLFKYKEDAHNGVYSTLNKIFVCPCCHNEYNRKIVNVIRNKHVSCPTCNDGFSYPEKFMANMLTQLNISFDYQYTNKEWTQNYIYDFRFDFNNKKYIIETDGGIGHGRRCISNLTPDESLIVDKNKEELAINNGYIVIRVDCDYKNDRYQYIKNSIIKSLQDIFDLSKIDWDICNQKALDSLFLKVIDCYKNETIFLDNISEITGVKIRTVTKYLNEAMKAGILPKKKLIKNNPYKDIPIGVRFIFNEKNYSSRNKKLYCYEDVTIFNSITDAAEYYGFNRCSIDLAIKEHNGAIKGKHFIYFDDLPKDYNFNEKNDFEIHRNNQIYQYDNDLKLIHLYKESSELKEKCPQYNYANIWRVCKGKRKTAYGFIWSFKKLTN